MSAKQVKRIPKRNAEKVMSSNLAGHQNKKVQIEAYSEVDNSIQNVYVPEITCPTNVLTELRDEIKELKNTLETSNKKLDVLTEEVQQCSKTIRKLENKKYDKSITLKHSTRFDKLPFLLMEELMNFNDELEKNEEYRHEFKNFIAKIDGELQSQFLRTAIRKVFTDDLASLFSWKGTNEKPSAEKLFVTTIIKNICHLKYKIEDKEISSILQKHFLHSKERLTKRKHCEYNT